MHSATCNLCGLVLHAVHSQNTCRLFRQAFGCRQFFLITFSVMWHPYAVPWNAGPFHFSLWLALCRKTQWRMHRPSCGVVKIICKSDASSCKPGEPCAYIASAEGKSADPWAPGVIGCGSKLCPPLTPPAGRARTSPYQPLPAETSPYQQKPAQTG